MLDQVVRYGYKASEVSPSSDGTYLAYDTRAQGWVLVDYESGTGVDDFDTTDWSTHANCIPYTKEELEHLYWYPTPDKKFDPEWEVINHEAKPGDEAWFERIYHCPRCKTVLGRTCHSHYIFGHSSILQNNRMPNFCPHCGLMMTWYGTRLSESFLEEENYG